MLHLNSAIQYFRRTLFLSLSRVACYVYICFHLQRENKLEPYDVALSLSCFHCRHLRHNVRFDLYYIVRDILVPAFRKDTRRA